MSVALADEGTVAIDDVRLHYRIEGTPGAPWLVFANSLLTDLGLWDAQVGAFAQTHRILRYDQRGHGRSSVPVGACTFPRLVEDLADLLDHLAIGRASVVGISMGGVTALGLAARHPDRVERVAICDCQPRSSADGAAAWAERIRCAEEGGMEALVEPTIRRWFTATTVQRAEPSLAPIRRMIAETPKDGFVRAARALQDYDFGTYPAALRCPALFLAGEGDPPLPAVRHMAEAAPHGRHVAISDAGHLPNVERPGPFNAALASFLSNPVTVGV